MEAALVDDAGVCSRAPASRRATGAGSTSEQLADAARGAVAATLAALPDGASLIGAGIGAAGPIEVARRARLAAQPARLARLPLPRPGRGPRARPAGHAADGRALHHPRRALDRRGARLSRRHGHGRLDRDRRRPHPRRADRSRADRQRRAHRPRRGRRFRRRLPVRRPRLPRGDRLRPALGALGAHAGVRGLDRRGTRRRLRSRRRGRRSRGAARRPRDRPRHRLRDLPRRPRTRRDRRRLLARHPGPVRLHPGADRGPRAVRVRHQGEGRAVGALRRRSAGRRGGARPPRGAGAPRGGSRPRRSADARGSPRPGA